ncbi:MAG: DUF2807 domain-containing protein [Saprospiraceae bacterium]|nr:DUF2807 domain-containing protein [Saprospiraceae bacterium]
MRLPLLLLVFSCLNVAAFAQKTVTRSLSSFDGIALSGGFDKVILKEGNTESITIEAEGVDPEHILTEIEGNTLGIRMKKGSYRNARIHLNITYRQLREVSNSGSSDIEALSPIKGEVFEFNSSGSGNFTGSFDVKKLEIAISGSSDMKLSGKAEKQEIAISGSGDVNAAALNGSEAEVAISGSGDVSLHVDGPVRSSVSGSGNVRNH